MTYHKVLEYAYKNDVVSVGTFSKATLEKFRKKGLLKFSPKSKSRYWITKKGLKLYKSGWSVADKMMYGRSDESASAYKQFERRG